MLNSSLWVDHAARELFITALLMASPKDLEESVEAIAIRDIKPAGFVIPSGWYGFVPASSLGIIARSGMGRERGLRAMERLCDPDPDSRSPDNEGRRMARVDGGFLILNYDKYRQQDYSSAERSKRYRERKKQRHAVIITPVTQAEEEAEEYNKKERKNAGAVLLSNPIFKKAWESHLRGLDENGLRKELQKKHFGLCKSFLEILSVEEIAECVSRSADHGFRFIKDPRR